MSRADRMRAAEPPEQRAPLQLLLLRLGRETYALPSSGVREIVRYRPFTVVPGAPPVLPGIISQRGAILPIVELRPLLSLPDTALTRAARLVILQHEEVDMALIVESVIDLVELPAELVTPTMLAIDTTRPRLVSGVAQHEGQVVSLLDLQAILTVLRGEG